MPSTAVVRTVKHFKNRNHQSHLNEMSQYQQDPFLYLSPEVIRSVIAHLPKETTENLRRVSKHWKTLAEYHCTSLAIKQHFPGTEAAQRTFKSVEEANLTFRRLCKTEILSICQSSSYILSSISAKIHPKRQCYTRFPVR